MRKYIVIGPCRMDIVMPAHSAPGEPISWMPGSPLQNAAILLAQANCPVSMVSEVSRDAIGSLLVHNLESAGVNTQSVDRVSNGEATSTAVFFASGASPVIYAPTPDDRFDAPWPRIDPDDVVIFGAPDLLKPRAVQFMSDLLDHVADRKAIAVYAPMLTPTEVPRITRATPVILDLLEKANIAFLTATDTMLLFTDTEAEKCYREHVRFYCPTMVYVNPDSRTLSIFHDNISASAQAKLSPDSLIWHAGALASLAKAIDSVDVRFHDNEPLAFTSEQLQAIASLTADGADAAASSAVINH